MGGNHIKGKQYLIHFNEPFKMRCIVYIFSYYHQILSVFCIWFRRFLYDPFIVIVSKTGVNASKAYDIYVYDQKYGEKLKH